MSCFKKSENDLNLRQEKYIIPGDPIPLARPRFANGRVFDSQKMKKLVVINSISQQHASKKKFQGPVRLEVTFFMKMPRVNKKKLQELQGAWHMARPDFSNLLKWVEDIAQEIVYDDDCIISSVCGSKIYDEEPRTEFIISEMRL